MSYVPSPLADAHPSDQSAAKASPRVYRRALKRGKDARQWADNNGVNLDTWEVKRNASELASFAYGNVEDSNAFTVGFVRGYFGAPD